MHVSTDHLEPSFDQQFRSKVSDPKAPRYDFAKLDVTDAEQLEQALSAIIEMVREGNLPQRGFLKQEDVDCIAYSQTATGSLFLS